MITTVILLDAGWRKTRSDVDLVVKDCNVLDTSALLTMDLCALRLVQRRNISADVIGLLCVNNRRCRDHCSTSICSFMRFCLAARVTDV